MTENTPPGLPVRLQRRRWMLTGVLALQIICILYFVADAVLDQFGLELEPAQDPNDVIETLVVAALALGAIYLGLEFRRMAARQKALEDQMRVASGAFHDLLEEHFTEWALTPSERDVAMFIIKGMSVAEIADLRSSAEGTVKAHSSRIYAKAGVSGRHQLISLFIEELLSEGLTASAP